MNTIHALLLSALLLVAMSATAHVGPEALDRHIIGHLIEHLLLTLALALPLFFTVRYLFNRGRRHH